MLDLAGTNAECERTEGAVRSRVRVAADDRQARLRDAQLGTNHMDDALAAMAPRVVDDAEVFDVLLERVDLLLRDRIADAVLERRGRRVVVGRCERAVGATDATAGEAEALKGLWGRDFVDQVQVDKEQVVIDHVRIPDLLVGRASHRGAPSAACVAERYQRQGRILPVCPISLRRS